MEWYHYIGQNLLTIGAFILGDILIVQAVLDLLIEVNTVPTDLAKLPNTIILENNMPSYKHIEYYDGSFCSNCRCHICMDITYNHLRI
jgi:hypothetical protein